MNGRRVYHARGKVLGGSSSINGMIFQRGNPLDYERWGADPGMETWDYAHCLPYFKRMETCLAAAPDDPFRGHSGPLILERGPATNPLFGAFFEAVQQAGYRLTEDVNGVPSGGLRAVRPQHPSRPPAGPHPRRTCTRRCGARTSRCARASLVTRVLFEGTRAVGVEVTKTRGGTAERVMRRRGHPVRRRDQHAAGAAALGRRQRRRARGARGRRRARPPRRGRAPPGPPRGVHPVRVQAAGLGAAVPEAGATGRGSASSGCSSAAASARRTTSRAAGSRGATTTSTTRT